MGTVVAYSETHMWLAKVFGRARDHAVTLQAFKVMSPYDDVDLALRELEDEGFIKIQNNNVAKWIRFDY